jgi:hypothetical protein
VEPQLRKQQSASVDIQADGATGRTQKWSPIRLRAGTLHRTKCRFVEAPHPGSTAGYAAWLGRIPAKNLSIAVACNASSADVLTMAHRLAALFSDMPTPSKPIVSKEVEPGLYLNPRDHTTTQVERTASNITLDGRPNKLNAGGRQEAHVREPVYGKLSWSALKLGSQRH